MRKILTLLTLLLTLTTTAWAQHIKLFAKPDPKAKIVATIASGKRLLPIYYPKHGKWIKVANPNSGQVGWVKFKDLSGHSNLPGFKGITFRQEIISKKHGKDGRQVFRVITYHGKKELTPSEVKAMVKRMQKRIKGMQIEMSRMTQKMMYDMENFQHTDPIHFGLEIDNFSLLQPIIIIPTTYTGARHKSAKRITS